MDNLYLAATSGAAWNVAPAARPAGGANSGSGETPSTRADSTGHFEIIPDGEGGEPGLYLVTAEGLAPALEVLEADSPGKVILEKGSRVTVHLLNAQAKPVGDADAVLIPLSLCGAALQDQADSFLRTARGDPDGTVVFPRVPDGVYALRVVAKGRVSSNLAPLIIDEGQSEFRVRLPETRPFEGSVEFPPRASRSSGSVLACWKNPKGVPQWAEGRFASDDLTIKLEGVPFMEFFTLFARAESGFSSSFVPRDQLGDPEGKSGNLIRLRNPVSWTGKLEEGVSIGSLIVEPLFPVDATPALVTGAFSIAVGADRRFVIPEVTPAADRLKISAPGLGEVEVRLDEGAGGDLGIVRIPPRRTIEGRIALDGDPPPAGTQVLVRSGSRLLCRARPTAEGKFACATGEAEIRKIDFRVSLAGVELPLAPPPGDTSGLLAPALGGVIDLKVTRLGGTKGVKNLQLDIGSGGESGPGRAGTDQQARYAHFRDGVLRLHTSEETPIKITVSTPGGGPKATATVTASPGKPPATANLTLPRGPVVFGSVLARGARTPIAGAEVEIGSGSPYVEVPEVARITHAGAGGAWRFEEVPEETYRLAASASGYSPEGRAVAVPADTKQAPQELLLPSPGQVRGKVLGFREGSKAKVSLYSRTWWIGWNNYEGEVDSKGQFGFENVRPDRYQVNLWTRDASSTTQSRFIEISVQPGETTELEIDLRGRIVVSGRVFLGDRVAPGARVLFSKRIGKRRLSTGDSARVDGEGAYSISLPAPGRYRVSMIQPAQNSGTMAQLAETIEIGSGSSQTRDLRFSDARIRGRVLGGRGQPIPRADLHIKPSRSPTERPVDERWSYEEYERAGEDGTFEFGPAPPGEYRLEVFARGYSRLEVKPVSIDMNQILDLPDIVLEPETPLRVKVVDPQGVPQAGVYVQAFPPSSFENEAGQGKSDENGECAVKGLATGTYVLVALARGWPPAISGEVAIPLEESAPLPVLQLTPGGSLEVRVVGKSRAPVPSIVPQILDAAGRNVTGFYRVLADIVRSDWSTDVAGVARLMSVAPGSYSLKAGEGKDAVEEDFTISVGQTSRVTLVVADEEEE